MATSNQIEQDVPLDFSGDYAVAEVAGGKMMYVTIGRGTQWLVRRTPALIHAMNNRLSITVKAVRA